MRHWSGAGVLFALCMFAAATDQVTIWRAPRAGSDQPVPAQVRADDIAVVAQESIDNGPGAAGILIVAAVLLLGLFLLASSLSLVPFELPLERRFSWGRWSTTDEEPLPFPTGPPPGEAVDEARVALCSGEAKNGIVACWLRLERAAIDAGLGRDAPETAQEYSHRLVRTTAVDPTPMGELADLYREARFSDHPLGDHHRDLALAALDRITTDLDSGATSR